MTAERFLEARTRLKLRRGEFASALGIHRDTVRAYEADERPIPQTVAMAVQCLQNGLPPAT